MKEDILDRNISLRFINDSAKKDAYEFVNGEHKRYTSQMNRLAEYLADGVKGPKLVLLSGPSSSGKTTTAMLLSRQLLLNGIDSSVVSLDDFYRGRGKAPQLLDGSFDYESPEALHLDQLRICMRELIKDGCTWLPRFDFKTGLPENNKYKLQISEHSIVIFEGIHALQPIIRESLPPDNVVRLFVNTISTIRNRGQKLMARRDIRLVRRLLRDDRFRGSPPENTLRMWQQVVRGELEYLFPQVESVDFIIDTTHAFEGCVFASELIPQLKNIAPDHPYIGTANRLADILQNFEPLSEQLIPADSVLREFIG